MINLNTKNNSNDRMSTTKIVWAGFRDLRTNMFHPTSALKIVYNSDGTVTKIPIL